MTSNNQDVNNENEQQELHEDQSASEHNEEIEPQEALEEPGETVEERPVEAVRHHREGSIDRLIKGLWRSPLGLFGVALTTISITLMLAGTAVDLLGIIENPYASLVTYTVLPAGMILGLLLIPTAAAIRRYRWHKGCRRPEVRHPYWRHGIGHIGST